MGRTKNVDIQINIKFLRANKISKLNFYAMNYFNINKELESINWKEFLTKSNNMNEAVENFYSIVKSIITKFVKITHPKDETQPKRFNKNLIQVLHMRRKDIVIYLKKNENKMYDKLYKERRNMFHIGNKEDKIISQPKAFFSYTKTLCKSNKLPTIVKYFADNSKSVYNASNTNNTNNYST